MKMRVFLAAFIIILILIIALVIVIIFTFDANRYKGILITKLEESMGKDVKIDNISLSLLTGFGIEIKGMAIKDKDKTWDNFLLKAKNLNASVKILSLLKKDIQIQRLFVPELEINTGTGANSPVFRCGLDLSVRILINGMEFQKTEIPTTENRLKVITKRFSCSPQQDDMLKTLNAKGNVKLTNAVLDNVNVLKTVLDSLSMLPNVVQKLKDNLPENYKGLLNQDYTAFKPMKADFEIKGGRIYFDNLLVESDAFYLVNKGSVGMIDQSFGISSNLFIPKDLSGVFSNAVPELEYLIDDKGNITIPLEIKGKVPDISVIPDINHALQKLIESKGQELLNKLFKSIR
ncbi:MAG: hypothetical protein AUJ70_01580 [Candidatus Omnitrophica bacterium CG1_02_40_15]|nr:MAG: hypothetical protein AUJ70_01580 [Candidatus Omnitrophica bacterium CG1_02_40_15]